MKYILLGLLAILIIIQFFRIDKSTPKFDSSNDFMALESPPENVSEILTNACYDCHSYETKFPWYSEVAPFSWWLAHHIDEGREHLNLSLWGEYPAKRKRHKLKDMIEEVDEGEMPLNSYTWAHRDAKLTEDEKHELIGWLEEVQAGMK